MRNHLRSLVVSAVLALLPLTRAADSVLPNGVAPFDPRPVMAQVEKRITTDTYRFAVLGDSKHAPAFALLLKLLDNEIKPDFVLSTGDLVSAGAGTGASGEWERLIQEAGSEFRKRPWWPAIANHELRESAPVKRDRDADVEAPAADSASANFLKFYNLERDYYSFTFRNAVFIALPFPLPKGESLTWLESELKKAADAKKHIFVFNHEPFYTIGGKSKTEIPGVSTPVTKMFTQYGVRAVFSGHDHGYYRTIRDGVPYFISAGAGAKIYPAARMDEALPEDVYYFGDPRPLKPEAKVVELKSLILKTEGVKSAAAASPAKKSLYVYHNGVTGTEKITDQPDLFTVVVDVDGASVKLTCVSVRGEKFDDMTLTK